MGRNNADFKNQILYHGSQHPFEVGDVVTPQEGEPAYATSDVRLAAYYAAIPYGDGPVVHKSLPAGHIAVVEPLDAQEPETSTLTDKTNIVAKSTKGFRVIGKVGSLWPNPDRLPKAN